MSQIYLALGETDAAVEQARRTVELDPQFAFGRIDLTFAQIKKGQLADASSSAAKAVELGKRSSRSLICLGVAHAASGRRGEAEAIVKEIEERYKQALSMRSAIRQSLDFREIVRGPKSKSLQP